MQSSYPVLILAFNRPSCTKRLLDQVITIYGPQRLYFSVDGPRASKPADLVKVAEVQALVEQIPTSILVQTRFRRENWGCRRAVSDAITWFFQNEEAGIILEDDIEPSESFFRFCDFGLREYADDPSILHVGGFLYLGPGYPRPSLEFFKTTYPHVWGWATWRRAWQFYDPTLVDRPSRERKQWLGHAVSDWRSVLFYDLALTLTKQEKMNSWAFRWFLSTCKHKGYALTPAENLVRNVGIGVDSTHSRFEYHVADSIAGSVEPVKNTPKALVFEKAVSDRFHLYYNRADSLKKLVRMYLSTFVSRDVFMFLRRLRG